VRAGYITDVKPYTHSLTHSLIVTDSQLVNCHRVGVTYRDIVTITTNLFLSRLDELSEFASAYAKLIQAR